MNLVRFNEDLSAALVSQHRMADDYSTVEWKGVEESGLQRRAELTKCGQNVSPMVQCRTTITTGIVLLPITRPSYRSEYCMFMT
jgi:hypothetical protein